MCGHASQSFFVKGTYSFPQCCRCNLYLGTDLSHRDCMFTEAPCRQPAKRNTRSRQKKSSFMKWLIGCTAAQGVRATTLQCYHRETGLGVSDWHWIGGHGRLKLSLLSDLTGVAVIYSLHLWHVCPLGTQENTSISTFSIYIYLNVKDIFSQSSQTEV